MGELCDCGSNFWASKYKEASSKRLVLLFAIYEQFLLIYYFKSLLLLDLGLKLLIYFQLFEDLLHWGKEFIY